jgi:hypothetical protein
MHPHPVWVHIGLSIAVYRMRRGIESKFRSANRIPGTIGIPGAEHAKAKCGDERTEDEGRQPARRKSGCELMQSIAALTIGGPPR